MTVEGDVSLNIIIREACESDLSILIEYNRALAEESENLSLDKDILQLGIIKAMELKDCNYFVAELNDDVVGQSMITSEWSDWRNGNLWWIQSVYVVPSSRRQGIFRALYEDVVSLAQGAGGVRGIRLYVEKDNRNAQAVYQKLGMSETAYRVFETMF